VIAHDPLRFPGAARGVDQARQVEIDSDARERRSVVLCLHSVEIDETWMGDTGSSALIAQHANLERWRIVEQRRQMYVSDLRIGNQRSGATVVQNGG
jgi:hypothetical protein